MSDSTENGIMSISEFVSEQFIPEADLVDQEDTSSAVESVEPWDPAKIRITTKTFSLRDVVDQIRDGDIDLSPDFQREYVWKPRQRTRLIESILLGIPLPAFYFNQAEDGTFQVVDGVQRLSTISLFMNDKHRVSNSDLEYLNSLDGRTYSELDPAGLRRFRSTQIVVHVIEPQTPDEVKFDIFNRVNTLGSPLSAQEIRHAMSKGRSREFIGRLAEAEEFDLATEHTYWRKSSEGTVVRHSGRMANRELVLRFCAFRFCSVDEYRQYPSLDSFLIDFSHRLDGVAEPTISDEEMDRLEKDFIRAMINGRSVLGGAAFRRWPSGNDRRGPINRAVFESQANALADFELHELLPKKEAIMAAFRKAFDDQEYLRAVTVSTGDPNKVAFRLEETRRVLESALR